jgi:hypothetical protein
VSPTSRARDEARQRVLGAALRLAAAREVSGGRQTAGDSHDLDHAEDMFDDALSEFAIELLGKPAGS